MITRDEFIKDLKTQLDELNRGIEEIEHRAESVRKGVREKLQVRINYLRKKYNSAFSKLQAIKNSSELAWHDLKQGTENVVDALKNALTITMAHFKKSKSKSDVIVDKLSE